MRVLVCGGRAYSNKERLFIVLDAMRKKWGDVTIISGAQRGADSFAAEWAMDRGLPLEWYQAKWRDFGNIAGPVRNLKMILEGKPDVVVAFPGNTGTNDMKRQARQYNIRVIEVQ